MNYDEYDLPDDLLYNKDSSWVKIEGGVATIGIIAPVAKALKEFLFIKLPDSRHIKAGEVYVSLEALKWSGHLTCPVSGEIIEKNEALYDAPGKVNERPYDSWIVKVRMEDAAEKEKLFPPKDILGWLDKTLKG